MADSAWRESHATSRFSRLGALLQKASTTSTKKSEGLSCLLKGLVELALLEQLQDAGLLSLVVQVRGGDGRASRRSHGLHDAGGDGRLLLLHSQANLPFDDPLHLAKNGLLQTSEQQKSVEEIPDHFRGEET